MTRSPASTYRLQITEGFPLQAAADCVGYVHTLGADWLYLSPLLQATHGSDHGYDVVDHSRTDESRGGADGLRAVADRAHRASMGVLVDIVPNHVGVEIPRESVWWWDVLTHGRDSAHAAAFDIDWGAGDDRILIPILGDGADELAALRIEDGRLHYYEHVFPIAAGTDGGSPRAVHGRQHYELVSFRRADTDLNYRRFFAVSTLAAIRVEDPTVFADSHMEIGRWCGAGWVDGLRVDHPDGLADPGGYLQDLSRLSGDRYTVVEKILEPGEELPADWRCDGTTGYDALALIDRLLIDPRGEQALTALDRELRGGSRSWLDLVHGTKRSVADGILGSEVRRLARMLHEDPSPLSTMPLGKGAATPSDPGPLDTAPADAGPVDTSQWERDVVDAIAELLASFPVYRSYLPRGADALASAAAEATRRRPDLARVIAVVAARAGEVGSPFAVRMQQTSGAVMAKGVEDGAFYRYPRLTSLTEVGGDPSVFACSPTDFHAAQAHRLVTWPRSMTTLSTHDTKRGEDVRARIDVLAEIPHDWAALVRDIVTHTEMPDGVLANLLLQTAIGAWPLERDRLHAYAEKAAREAGTSTGWIDPDPGFERQLHALVDALYDHVDLRASIDAFVARIRPAGWSNSLAAKLIQLTIPGVPDVYRGTELWSTDLVDPDNRRPFDPGEPGGAAELLDRLDAGWLPEVDETGAAKLLVTSRTLRARRDRPELFTDYRPVAASGPAAEHVVAFDRGGAITVATRLPLGLASRGGWVDTAVDLGGDSVTDVLTGAVYEPEGPSRRPQVPVEALLRRYPVALLMPTA